MASSVHPQLPLGFEPGELFTFESFVAGNNSVATGLAQKTAVGEGEKQLYFWGDRGLGKSHLLQASCNLAAKNRRTVCYLTQAEILNQSVEIFDGLEQLELICLDDIETWLTDKTWEIALFDLINRVRESNHCLMLASAHPPDEAFVKLPDLRSRLSWARARWSRTAPDRVHSAGGTRRRAARARYPRCRDVRALFRAVRGASGAGIPDGRPAPRRRCGRARATPFGVQRPSGPVWRHDAEHDRDQQGLNAHPLGARTGSARIPAARTPRAATGRRTRGSHALTGRRRDRRQCAGGPAPSPGRPDSVVGCPVRSGLLRARAAARRLPAGRALPRDAAPWCRLRLSRGRRRAGFWRPGLQRPHRQACSVPRRQRCDSCYVLVSFSYCC